MQLGHGGEKQVSAAIGGDTTAWTLHPPVARIGFDMGTQWTGIEIRFYGENDVLLATFDIADFALYGTGPNGYFHQGFVGFEDDGGTLVHRVELGSGDHYVDNVYLGFGSVDGGEASWSGVKNLFR